MVFRIYTENKKPDHNNHVFLKSNDFSRIDKIKNGNFRGMYAKNFIFELQQSTSSIVMYVFARISWAFDDFFDCFLSFWNLEQINFWLLEVILHFISSRKATTFRDKMKNANFRGIEKIPFSSRISRKFWSRTINT